MPAKGHLVQRLQDQERLNFWLTNRIPRKLVTRWFGRFSRIESRWLTAITIRIWRWFADDLRLEEAKTNEFNSLRECFIRELKPGCRPVDPRPHVLTSPCDAVVGAHGHIREDTLLQAKGMVYSLARLLRDPVLAASHDGGCYVTLRLKSSMYHRFHAPAVGTIGYLDYIAGETWNVNPPTLRRIEALFCVNERAVLPLQTAFGPITLVPVAAVLVASMRFSFVPKALNMDYRGPARLECDSAFDKGQELGWFEHGSTVIVLTGPGFTFSDQMVQGRTIRMGEALLHWTGD